MEGHPETPQNESLERLEFELRELQAKEDIRLRGLQIQNEYDLKLKEIQLRQEESKKQQSLAAVAGRSFAACIPLIATVLTLGFGYSQFVQKQAADQRSEDTKNRAAETATAQATKEKAKAQRLQAILEGRKLFNSKQLTTYEKTLKVVGDVVQTHTGGEKADKAKYKSAVDQFESLYWIDLPLVEDHEVEVSAIRLRETIYGRMKDESVEKRALRLSRAIRISLDHLYEPDKEWPVTSSQPVPAKPTPGKKQVPPVSGALSI